MTLGHVYALIEGKPALGLYPFLQYAETATGQSEVFLFEEVNKQEAVLRTYPTGQNEGAVQ